MSQPLNAHMLAQAILGTHEPMELLGDQGYKQLVADIKVIAQEAEVSPTSKTTALHHTTIETLANLQVHYVDQDGNPSVELINAQADNGQASAGKVYGESAPAEQTMVQMQTTATQGMSTAIENAAMDAPKADVEDDSIHLNNMTMNSSTATAMTARMPSIITTPSYVNATDVMEQVMAQVRLFAAEGFAEIRMTLRPANLGDLTLRIATVNGLVTAQFAADNQRIKEIIESNFNHLRDVLQEQGVQVSELSVSVKQEGNDSSMPHLAWARWSNRGRMLRATGATTALPQETAGHSIPKMDMYSVAIDYRV
jgi:flagellar hook-length control protein FliK